MDTHVKVLAILQIVLGALGIMAALFVVLIFGGVAGLVAVSGDRDAALAVPIIGMLGTVAVTFILLMAVPGIIVGIGLLKLRPWARVFGIIVSILLLIHFPLGTVVGVYGLWVLLTSETERLFAAKSTAT